MTDAPVPLQAVHVLLAQSLVGESHALDGLDAAVVDRYAGGLLSSVLQNPQSIEDVNSGIGDGGYSNDPALILRVLRLQTSTPLFAQFSMRLCPVVSSSFRRHAESTRGAGLLSHMIGALPASAAYDVDLLAASLTHRWSAFCHPAYLTARCI